jgi:hypothetical protein
MICASDDRLRDTGSAAAGRPGDRLVAAAVVRFGRDAERNDR